MKKAVIKTVYDFGQYGGTYDLKEEGFQRILRNYLPEGADLFVGNPRDYILSPQGQDAIELFRADILKTQEANRAMGSPITGEGINGLKKLDDMRFRQMGSPMQGEIAQQAMMQQQNPENVGIMQGFEDDAKTIVDAGSEKKQEFDRAEDYEQLMNTIRGDNKSEDQRRDELAEIVGEKDAMAVNPVTGEEEISKQQIDHSKLVPLLVAAVQELITKVETLEAA